MARRVPRRRAAAGRGARDRRHVGLAVPGRAARRPSTSSPRRLNRRLHLIAESDLNDPRMVTPREQRRPRDATPSGATTSTTRCTPLLTGERERLLRRLRRARPAGHRLPPGLRLHGPALALPRPAPRRSAGRRSTPRASSSTPEPRPGRQPADRRAAGARCVPFEQLKLAARPGAALAVPAAAVHGRGVRRGRARSRTSCRHTDPELVEAVRRGRAEEFAGSSPGRARAARPAGRGELRGGPARPLPPRDARGPGAARRCTASCCGCAASARRCSAPAAAGPRSVRRARASGCCGCAAGAAASERAVPLPARLGGRLGGRRRPGGRLAAGARLGRRALRRPRAGPSAACAGEPVIAIKPRSFLVLRNGELVSHRIWPGAPYPLGATWDGQGVNFALFSEHATAVELCLFDRPEDAVESARIELPERTDFVWHGFFPDVRPGPAVRLPRARPVRARAGPPLQPAQAAARPLRDGDHRPDRLGRRDPRLHDRRPRRGPVVRRARQRPAHAEVRGRRPDASAGATTATPRRRRTARSSTSATSAA